MVYGQRKQIFVAHTHTWSWFGLWDADQLADLGRDLAVLSMIEPQAPLQDIELEAQIQLAWKALVAGATADVQRAAFAQMRDLIATRSAETIERMERERGLRVP